MTWKDVESLFKVLDSFFFYQDEILQTSETQHLKSNSYVLMSNELNVKKLLTVTYFENEKIHVLQINLIWYHIVKTIFGAFFSFRNVFFVF